MLGGLRPACGTGPRTSQATMDGSVRLVTSCKYLEVSNRQGQKGAIRSVSRTVQRHFMKRKEKKKEEKKNPKKSNDLIGTVRYIPRDYYFGSKDEFPPGAFKRDSAEFKSNRAPGLASQPVGIQPSEGCEPGPLRILTGPGCEVHSCTPATPEGLGGGSSITLQGEEVVAIILRRPRH
ncbi:hypothetical protein AOQ84DRAFT_110634 [Glonium stellatum]|uniref:Uncharacterized protein n=1 Tax=Glonium stellatum TaxID=574774 RepID=A0A8E2JPN2_9PEZI|nr:hypothetical protein AOQ84DRAFT_110634 [Glonium stellatum]